MKTCFNFPALLILLLILMGCGANLLPSTKITVKSPWDDFNNARLTYEKIIPGSSTMEDVKKLGFDPDKVPNIRIMTITDIIAMFLPNPSIRIQDLDPGIQKCLESKNDCQAYQIGPGVQNADRVGNFWLDLLTFKRRTINTGWEFRGVITLVNNIVTYRDPVGGRPLINTEQVDIKPLGPVQDLGSSIAPAGPAVPPKP